MIYRSPAEYYMKYLLCHPDRYRDEQIRDILNMQGLFFIGMPHLERLRMELAVPSPFYPEDRTHARSQNFLVRERILALFQPDEAATAATKLLDTPKAKMTLESLLLAEASPEYAASVMTHRGGVHLTVRAVQYYSHFFFNIGLVGLTELRALMRVRGVRNSADPDEIEIDVAMKATLNSDPRRLSARMAGSNLAMLMNNIRMGYLPSSVDTGRLVNTTRTAAIAMSLDSTLQSNPERARDFALVAKVMHEILTDVGDGGESLQEDLAQLAMATENSEVPHLSSLAAPNVNRPQLLEAKGEPVE